MLSLIIVSYIIGLVDPDNNTLEVVYLLYFNCHHLELVANLAFLKLF
jgi:hypothetical protein